CTATTAAATTNPESTTTHRVVHRASVARQEPRAHAAAAATRQLNRTTIDALEVDCDGERAARSRAIGRDRAASTTAASTRRATNALAHEWIVRVFRQPRERHREQLILRAVAIRREDQCLAVGRQLRSRLVPRALRDVVFLLGPNVIQIHVGVLLI